MATSRKTARAALATLLNASLVTTLGLVTTVYSHEPVSFTEAPVVIVRSRKTTAKRRGVGNTRAFLTFQFEIFIYVAAEMTSTYTASAAADTLDDIEAATRAVIIANPTNAAWAEMHLIGDDGDGEPQGSEVFYLKASDSGGLVYNAEILTVECMVYDT